MDKLVKAIKGFEKCLDKETDCYREDIGCPYEDECWLSGKNLPTRPLMEDAFELLKEKQPRVMKLEDVKAFEWDYCYLEEERLPGKEYRSVCGDYALTCITWPCIASMRIQHGDNSYGKKWRCWTAKPTEEQRKAVPWKNGDGE